MRGAGQGPLRLAVRRLTGGDPSQKKRGVVCNPGLVCLLWGLGWECRGSFLSGVSGTLEPWDGQRREGRCQWPVALPLLICPGCMEGWASSQAAIWRYTRRGMETTNTGLMKTERINQQVDISPTTPLSSLTKIHLTFPPSLSYTVPLGTPIFPLSRRHSCMKLSSVVVTLEAGHLKDYHICVRHLLHYGSRRTITSHTRPTAPIAARNTRMSIWRRLY